MQSQLPVAAVSGALRNLALELTRITNDLRLLASGPQTGLAEIILPAVQPGSSIMPGKVNPSMLECMNQVLFHIIGSATAIDYAVQAGQLELNVMMPLMAFEILFSIEILKNYLPVFIAKCIRRNRGRPRAMRGLLHQLSVAGHGAQSDHRLREGGGDRQGVGQDRHAHPDAAARKEAPDRRGDRAHLHPRVSGGPGGLTTTIRPPSTNPMRLFIAISFPEQELRAISDRIAMVKSRLPPASWVRPETQHLTFAFLGEQPESLLPTSTTASRKAWRKFRASRDTCAAADFFRMRDMRESAGSVPGRKRSFAPSPTPCAAKLLLRSGADPADARVARVRKKAAAAQVSLEARNVRQALLDARRERRQQRLRLLAEEGEGEVLRLGTHPRRRRQPRFDHRNAVADRAEAPAPERRWR